VSLARGGARLTRIRRPLVRQIRILQQPPAAGPRKKYKKSLQLLLDYYYISIIIIVIQLHIATDDALPYPASSYSGDVQFGDDEFGHMLVNILKQNNVNSEGCLFDKHARTALAFVTLKHDGEREFMFYRNPSADMLLTEAELDLGLVRRARVFHYGSISLISEPCRSAHMAAMRAAKAAGVLCSYDPNVRLPLWPSPDAAREGILSIWKEADFIKVSDDEVAFLTRGDANDEKNVLSLWFDGLKLLVVTDGDKGCRYFTKDFKGSVPGFKVDTVDTTGAGDAFVGSLLVNVAKDDSIFHVWNASFSSVAAADDDQSRANASSFF
jgi:fructokinase